MFFLMAWKNIWRNKRRTLITAASIFFAVFFAIIMRGFHLGAWDHMLNGVLHSYTGYIQVHQKGYWDDKSFDYSMEYNDSLQKSIASVPHVRNAIPRLESFALASAGLKTKGVIVNGIDPEREDKMTQLTPKLVSGNFLKTGDSSVVISKKLSEFLRLGTGDTIILIGQGYQGNSANGKFVIKGVVKLSSPEFDNKMVYLPLQLAQQLYSSDGRITSLVIDLDHSKNMGSITKALKQNLDLNTYEVLDWTEMMKELYQQFIIDNASGLVMLVILYLIVGFGVFGTVLMMTNERLHEFGIMVAVGMQKFRLAFLIGTELLYVVTLGLLAGIMGSIPLLTYFHLNPITITGPAAEMYTSMGMEPVMPILWQSNYIFNQGLVVLILVIIAIIYPIFKISKLDVTKAIRSR